MGHFSHSCKLTGLPITSGTPIALVVMKHNGKIYEYSDESLQKYGQSSWVTNDTTQAKFSPVWFPILGIYNDYGGVEQIIEDDNTRVLEKFYDLTIQEIVDVVCSGRKKDGYDKSLKVIKEDPILPDDHKKGLDWFAYYQRTQNDPMPFGNGVYPDVRGKFNKNWTVVRDGKRIKTTKEQYDADFKLINDQYARYQKWLEENPDPINTYGRPEYKENFKELLTYSAMWVHGSVYKKLGDINNSDPYDKIDLGTPEILNALGFEEIESEIKDKERYNKRFKKDDLILNSDGTWLEVPDDHLYTLPALKKYCKKKGVDIDISSLEDKDRIEQIFDYIIPTVKNIDKRDENTMDRIINKVMEKYNNIPKEDLTEQMQRSITYMLLNRNQYKLDNPLTKSYFEAAKEGKLKDNIVSFWRFDSYMYCAGKYYDIIGTSPQDGEHKAVMDIINVASEVLSAELAERKKWEDEDEYEEDED